MYYQKILDIRNKRLGEYKKLKEAIDNATTATEISVIMRLFNNPVTLQDILRMIGKKKKNRHINICVDGEIWRRGQVCNYEIIKLDLSKPISEQEESVLEKLYLLIK